MPLDEHALPEQPDRGLGAYRPPADHPATKPLLSNQQENVDYGIKRSIEGVNNCSNILHRLKNDVLRLEEARKEEIRLEPDWRNLCDNILSVYIRELSVEKYNELLDNLESTIKNERGLEVART